MSTPSIKKYYGPICLGASGSCVLGKETDKKRIDVVVSRILNNDMVEVRGMYNSDPLATQKQMVAVNLKTHKIRFNTDIVFDSSLFYPCIKDIFVQLDASPAMHLESTKEEHVVLLQGTPTTVMIAMCCFMFELENVSLRRPNKICAVEQQTLHSSQNHACNVFKIKHTLCMCKEFESTFVPFVKKLNGVLFLSSSAPGSVPRLNIGTSKKTSSPCVSYQKWNIYQTQIIGPHRLDIYLTQHSTFPSSLVYVISKPIAEDFSNVFLNKIYEKNDIFDSKEFRNMCHNAGFKDQLIRENQIYIATPEAVSFNIGTTASEKIQQIYNAVSTMSQKGDIDIGAISKELDGMFS